MPLRSRSWPLLAFVLLVLPPAARADQTSAEALSSAQKAEFLRTARVVKAKDLSKGVTRPRKLTLTDGTITHDGVFQSVDQTNQIQRFQNGRVETNFRDSYEYNIAAYRLAVILGLDHMVPVTVERTYDGKRGSLCWWITWRWDEQLRQKEKAQPPDGVDWAYQQNHMRVFGELIHDTDRNMGNQLITEDWRLWMVDFTRAFRRLNFLRSEANVQRCSRALFEKLTALTDEQVSAATAPYLRPGDVKALLKRRDLIVERLERLARERGDHLVFY
jgi:hypothetical protein